MGFVAYTLATPEEGSRFGITYDSKFVYLGIQVIDNDLVNGAANTTSRQDFVGFVLDGQPLVKCISEQGESGFKNSVYFIASPADNSGKNSVSELDDSEKQLEWKCVKNKNGYAFEVAIPIAYVQKQQGENWQNVRVNVVVQDKDANSSTRVMWQPTWSSRENVAGSGMFYREATGKR